MGQIRHPDFLGNDMPLENIIHSSANVISSLKKTSKDILKLVDTVELLVERLNSRQANNPLDAFVANAQTIFSDLDRLRKNLERKVLDLVDSVKAIAGRLKVTLSSNNSPESCTGDLVKGCIQGINRSLLAVSSQIRNLKQISCVLATCLEKHG